MLSLSGDVDDIVRCCAEGLFGVLWTNNLLGSGQTGSWAQDWAVHYFYCPPPIATLPTLLLCLVNLLAILDSTIFTAPDNSSYVHLFFLKMSEAPKKSPFLFCSLLPFAFGFLHPLPCIQDYLVVQCAPLLGEVGIWQSSEPIDHRPSLMLSIEHRTDDADRKKGLGGARCRVV